MIDFTNVKEITIPEGIVKQIVRKSDGAVLWKSGPKNWVEYSKETDGITIYNGGLGYKNGYRVRSGGAEAPQSGSAITGYIPVKGGSVIRVAGTEDVFLNGQVSQAVNVYSSKYVNLGQIVGNSPGYGMFGIGGAWRDYNNTTVIQKDTYYQWTLPPAEAGIAYIRVTGEIATGANLIVTVDEEIE